MYKTHFFGIPLEWLMPGALVLLFLALGGAAAYGYYRIAELSQRTEALQSTLASTTALLVASLEETQASLSSTLQEQKQNLEEQLEDVSGTVDTLEKLSKTDPELLQKYSKVYFLNEHYVPERLVEIPDQYEYTEAEHSLIHALVWPHLKKLMDRANRDGVEIYVSSAYRSFTEQDALKGQYTTVYGAGTASQFSADQGYSEHQLGTTVDFITTGLGGQLEGFERTEAYEWLLENAHRYGFILSYPANNSYYIFEPWHWRYVGEELAEDLHADGKYFYDLEQREIDKYLVSLFD
jgi:D-alanyl-D-alanine carboxypeptidase